MPALGAAVAAVVGSISWGAVAAEVAVGVGASLLSSALAPHPSAANSSTAGSDLNVQIGANTPVQFPLGWSATAGMLSYVGTWGSSGSTPNAFAVFETVLSFLPVPGKPVPWIGTQKCTVDWTATPVAQGYPILEFRVNGVDYAWAQYDDGTQTTAPAYMVDKFGSHPTRPYTSDMVGYGLAKVRLTLLINSSFWGGSPPAVLYETNGIALYDISKDSTAGGSGSHRWGVYSTYEPSNNPAVQIYNVRRGIFYYPSSGDPQWVYGGNNKRALSVYRMPAASWIAAINACNQTVTNADSTTEPQFRSGMIVTGATRPADVITALNAASQGRMAEVGGIYELTCGAPGASVLAFTDTDVIISDPSTFTPFPGLSDTYNAVEATYPEPSQKWASNDAPGRYNSTWEDEDGGRQLVASAQFDAVPYANQVQRLMQAIANDNRQFRVHQVTLPPSTYDVVKPNVVVSWTSARFGYSDKLFIITAVAGKQGWNQQVTIKELDPTDYDFDPATQHIPASIGTLTFDTAPPQPMSGWTASASTVQDASGADRRPAIIIGATGLMEDVQSVHVQVRVVATQQVVFDGYSPYDSTVTSPAWILSGDWCLPATAYEVRGKLVPKSGRKTYWSNETLDGDGNPVEGDWLGVTTPNISLGKADFSDALNAQLTWATSAINDLINNLDILSTLLNDQDKANYVDKTQILANLATQFGASTAAISSVAQVAASANEATAAIATAAQVTANQATASGLVSLTLDSGGSGTTAKITQELSTSTGGGAVTSAMETLEIDSDGTSIKTIVADKFRLTDASADTLFEWDSVAGTLSIGNA